MNANHVIAAAAAGTLLALAALGGEADAGTVTPGSPPAVISATAEFSAPLAEPEPEPVPAVPADPCVPDAHGVVHNDKCLAALGY